MYSFKTNAIKKNDLTIQWWLVDAQNQTVGRLASKIAHILQGKHKPTYTPNLNCGDKVIIINAEKIRFTGKKMNNKTYISHTGYPGGQRVTTPKKLIESQKADRIIFKAIERMLPKTKLQKPFMKNLFLYTGPNHNHTAQKPVPLNF